MADQNDQQSAPNAAPALQTVTPAPVPNPAPPTVVVTVTPPPAAPAPGAAAPTEVQKVETVVENGFSAVVKDLWSKYGIFFILVGIVLIAIKFNDIIAELLGLASKKDVEDAQATDAKLQAKENAYNQQADALVKQANDLPSQEGTVDENWDKKQGN